MTSVYLYTVGSTKERIKSKGDNDNKDDEFKIEERFPSLAGKLKSTNSATIPNTSSAKNVKDDTSNSEEMAGGLDCTKAINLQKQDGCSEESLLMKSETCHDIYFSKSLASTSIRSKTSRDHSQFGMYSSFYHPYARYAATSRGHDVTPCVIPRLSMLPEGISPYSGSLLTRADSKTSSYIRALDPQLLHSSLHMK